jgi:hypothetical protein
MHGLVGQVAKVRVVQAVVTDATQLVKGSPHYALPPMPDAN